MRRTCWTFMAAVLLMSGCGVGPEAGRLAQREVALLQPMPEDDDGVRAALLFQADAWNALAVQLARQELGGRPVGGDFRELVLEVGTLARRQKALMAAGQDDAASNREALAQMKGMWEQAARYLEP